MITENNRVRESIFKRDAMQLLPRYTLWTGEKFIAVGMIEFFTDGSIHVNEEFPIGDKDFPTPYRLIRIDKDNELIISEIVSNSSILI